MSMRRVERVDRRPCRGARPGIEGPRGRVSTQSTPGATISGADVIAGCRFMSVQEAARFLGVSPKSLYAWVSQRRIPYRKAGRRLLFLESELVEWTCPSVKSREGPKAKRPRRDRCAW